MTRAETVLAALGASRTRTRGTRRLTLISAPTLVRDAAGTAVGIETWVELTDDGAPVDIDPHRRILNPPAGGDPRAAFWDTLWASVTDHPSPETTARPRKAPRP